jgi:hypothetical protein
MILLTSVSCISVSCVARVIGMTQQCLASIFLWQLTLSEIMLFLDYVSNWHFPLWKLNIS